MGSGIAKFIMTVMEAAVLLALAFLVLRSDRRRFLNLSFALFLLLLALWCLFGFLHYLPREPGGFFVSLVFRISYFFGSLAAGVFLLFGISFKDGRRPARGWMWLSALASFSLAFSSLAGLVIEEASFVQGRFSVRYGPLYLLFVSHVALSVGGGLVSIALKWSRSRGVDRARAGYVLLGFGVFILLAFLLAVIMPGLTGVYDISDYIYFLIVLPILFTAYAMLRHRLLDVRLAVRRTFAYLLTLLLFGGPLLALYLAFRFFLSSYPDLELAASLTLLALAVALSPAALGFSGRLAARILFPGLYDEVELLHEVSAVFASTADVRDGLISATRLACSRLGLSRLLVAIPEDSTRGKGNWVIGYDEREAAGGGRWDMKAPDSPLFHLHETLLADNGITTSGEHESERAEMRERGLFACLPVRNPAGNIAVLLAGARKTQGALEPYDLDFLAHFAERAAVFIDNYLLSSYLLSQFEELSRLYKRLKESDEFKTEVINITSHELRTPLTILNGYAAMLRERHGRFSEEERKRCLEYIATSCRRLNDILDQFLTVSDFQRGDIHLFTQTIVLKTLLEELRSAFAEDKRRRIEVEVDHACPAVTTDRSLLLLILNNLVENALRFSPDDQPVTLAAEKAAGGVRVSVSDKGQGIDREDVQYIFQPFARLEEMDKHHIGTGLGLYLVRMAADLLGIEVEVESEPGRGTVFHLLLPLP